MNRPKISATEVTKILNFFFPGDLPPVVVIAVRGYFLNSYGKAGVNDQNVWDDAILVCDGGEFVRAFNANTDPSKANAELAMLDTGIYRFYRGMHKQRIEAFRAYPEGVRLKCKRQDARGNWFAAFCSAINLHDGGEFDTWSAGCQTLPNYKGNKQFNEFRELVYGLMDKHRAKTMTYLLIDEKQMQSILKAPVKPAQQPPSKPTVQTSLSPIPAVINPPTASATAHHEPTDRDVQENLEHPIVLPPSPPVILGDKPTAAPKQWLNVEDYKPWVVRMIKRIWGTFVGMVIAYVGTIVTTAQNADYSDPRVWIVIAAIGVVFLFVIAAFFTLIFLAVLYFNRKEIVGYKTEEIKSLINPNIYNFGLKFEKK